MAHLPGGGEAPPANRVNLFVIGAKKAGTTWLYHLLDGHPQIFMCAEKELYYFGRRYPAGLDAYHEHFPFHEAFRYYGEATPEYFRLDGVEEELAQYNADARLLAVVRDPIVRLRSEFTYQKQLGNLPESLPLDHLVGPHAAELRENSRYDRLLPRFEQTFGPRQFKVISLEAAAEDTLGAWTDLLTFLDLRATPVPALRAGTANVTGSRPFRTLYRTFVRPLKKRSPRLYEALLQSKAASRLKKGLLSVLGTADEAGMPAAARAQLRDEFAPTYRYLRRLGFARYDGG